MPRLGCSPLSLLLLACAACGPGASQPRSLPKDNLTEADRRAWMKQLPVPAECRETAGDAPRMTFHRLGRGRFLIAVTCAPGSYQPGESFLLWNEGKTPAHATALRLRMVQPAQDGKSAPHREAAAVVWGTYTLDSESQILTVLNRYRAPGDCGEWGRYKMDGDQARAIEFRLKPRCDGKDAGQPEKWPDVTSRLGR